ncbi:MAG TPA: ATP-binding protein [bacterium]|nr:ATP-binding protein [Myxococcales bacterium]HPW45329.1 ATP-binding protein [bacterium]HQC50450.1 ATP-binding protein [bacterium]
MPFSCELTIPSETSKLAPLREWLASVQGLVGEELFPKRALFPCTIALVEAVDNAIFHAHDENGEKPISISLRLNGKGITMDIGDCGCGMKNVAADIPDEMSDRGRGLFLMNRLMTRVESLVIDGNHRIRMEYEI